MRGQNIKNIYYFDGKVYRAEELSSSQKELINRTRDLSRYNTFRHRLMENHGNDVVANIRIHLPKHEFKAYAINGTVLLAES